MSNQRYVQFRYSKEKKVVDLFAKVTFGSSGAPTLSASASKGVKSVVRNGAGDYTFTMTDSFQSLLMCKHVFDASGNGGSAPASPSMYVKAKTSSTVRVVFNSAGTATDPASTEIVLMQFAWSDTTAI